MSANGTDKVVSKRIRNEVLLQSDLRKFCRVIMDYGYGKHRMYGDGTGQWKSIFDDPYLDEVFDMEKRHPEWGCLYLLSRGTLKSTVLSSARPLSIALKDPTRVQILIVVKSKDLGEKIIGAILQALQNPIAKEIWGEHVGGPIPNKPSKPRPEFHGKRLIWRNNAIQLIGARQGDPTIIATTINKIPTGLHPTHIIVDDVCTHDNSKTLHRAQSLKDHVDHLYPLLRTYEPSERAKELFGSELHEGRIDFVGTRYSERDLYSEKMRTIAPDKQLIKGCWADPDETVPAFKSMHTREILDEFRNQMGDYNFSAQYKMKPIDEATALFTRNMYIWVPRANFPEFTETVISCDPTIGISASSDEAGLVAAGTDGTRIYKIDELGVVQGPTAILDTIIEMANKHGIKNVCYEGNLFQCTIGEIWEPEIERRKIDLQIHLMPRRNTDSKPDLWRQMRRWYENRQVVHCLEQMDGKLEHEQCFFNPMVKTNIDNVGDAMRQAIVYLSPYITTSTPPEDDSDLNFDIYDKKMTDRQKNDENSIDRIEDLCPIVQFIQRGNPKLQGNPLMTDCFLS